MNSRFQILCVLISMVFTMTEVAAQNDKPVCEIENNKVVFNLNREWSPEKQSEVANQFSIDSVLMQKAFSEERWSLINANGETWLATYPSESEVKLTKNLESGGTWNYKKDIYKMTNVDDAVWRQGPGYPDKAKTVFGVNSLRNKVIIQMKNGETTFILKGKSKANEVFLSGSFNDWATRQTKLVRNGDDWQVTIPLEPGPYYYKYIVDGEWTTDPDNKNKVGDGFGGNNSVLFRYNYEFILDAHPDAKKVFLAGTFSDWNTKGLEMERTAQGWNLPVYLKDGTYGYKFVVDENWIVDPDNPIKRPDGQGNYNSFMALGDTTYFRLYGYQNAKSVWLTGSFNGWNPDEILMHRTDSCWEIPYVLADGNYEYKFVVDGEWTLDPSNKLKIYHGDYINSFMSIGKNHTFELEGYSDAAEVVVTGNFTGWSEDNNRMIWKNSKWIFPMRLEPGKHLYRFKIDGEWLTDPANPLFEANEFGGTNSILWIEERSLP